MSPAVDAHHAALGASCLLALCLSCGCERDLAPTTQPASARLIAFVSIPPQAYFVERVAGDLVDVRVLVGPGQSPHTYEPTPRQMTEVARARVYFGIGVPFENALLPRLRSTMEHLEICDTSANVSRRRMRDDELLAEDDNHAHEGPDNPADDPHIWLSPRLVKIQARTICDALCRLDRPNAERYEANLAAFVADLDALDAEIAAALAPLKGRDLLVFHPAYGYFADAYGLRQVPVELEGKEPGARQIAALIARARRSNARVIFVQPQFSTTTAQAIAEQIDGVVVPLDPLARDYMQNMRAMAQAIHRGLSPR